MFIQSVLYLLASLSLNVLGQYVDNVNDPQQQQHAQQTQTQQIIFKPLQTAATSGDYHHQPKMKTIAEQYQQQANMNDHQYVKANGDEYIKVDDYDKPVDSGKHDDKAYAHQPYGFGYNIEDGYGNKQWRHEKSSSPHQVIGSYGFKDKNGIMREVEYVADKYGFRAVIKTTEPGTASSDPAYVKLNSNPVQLEYYPPTEQYPMKDKNSYQEQPVYKQPTLYSATPEQLQTNQPNAFVPLYGTANGKGAASSAHTPTLTMGPYDTANELMLVANSPTSNGKTDKY